MALYLLKCSAIGEKVSGSDKKKHKITDEVVAAHPNDEGMACIARLVMEQISVQNSSVEDK